MLLRRTWITARATELLTHAGWADTPQTRALAEFVAAGSWNRLLPIGQWEEKPEQDEDAEPMALYRTLSDKELQDLAVAFRLDLASALSEETMEFCLKRLRLIAAEQARRSAVDN